MADDEKDLASPRIGTMVTGAASTVVLGAAAARAKPGWLRNFLIACAAITGVVTLIGIIGSFSGGLPACDDKQTRDTLSDLNFANKFNATKYNFIKSVSKSDTEVVCTASLALKGGSNVEYDHRIYKEAGSVKVKITEVRK
jgi:hypothetical protein